MRRALTHEDRIRRHRVDAVKTQILRARCEVAQNVMSECTSVNLVRAMHPEKTADAVASKPCHCLFVVRSHVLPQPIQYLFLAQHQITTWHASELLHNDLLLRQVERGLPQPCSQRHLPRAATAIHVISSQTAHSPQSSCLNEQTCCFRHFVFFVSLSHKHYLRFHCYGTATNTG